MSSVTAEIAAVVHAISHPVLSVLPITRDEPASKHPEAKPYAVVFEGISSRRDTSSGRGVVRLSELVQLDLVQDRNPAPEDHTLIYLIRAALEQSGPRSLSGVGGGTLFRFRPESSRRTFDLATRLVTEQLTIRLVRTA